MDEVVFTSSAVLSLLSEIEELKGENIEFTETDDSISITIGNNLYLIQSRDAPEVEVSEESLEDVIEINEDNFDNLDVDQQEVVDGGVIKELVKTLFVGGLVRLTAKALKNA